MQGFAKWFKETDVNEGIYTNYYRNEFVKLPWNWQAMQKAKIINAFYYYAKANYVNGQPEQMEDYQFSLISLPNLKEIPHDQLSVKNIHTGHFVDYAKFFQWLRKPLTWSDDKIDQIYDGIKMIGKRPEDFGGKDIRQITT